MEHLYGAHARDSRVLAEVWPKDGAQIANLVPAVEERRINWEALSRQVGEWLQNQGDMSLMASTHAVQYRSLSGIDVHAGYSSLMRYVVLKCDRYELAEPAPFVPPHVAVGLSALYAAHLARPVFATFSIEAPLRWCDEFMAGFGVLD